MQKSTNIVLRLTYFWTFTEAGLGGVLHLYHIPLTGFIIGGFSVIINVLLARYAQYDKSLMLKTLGLVLVAKFALSPYSPFGAYVAVAFQGVLAILLFPTFGTNRFIVTLYAILTMLESAIQKPLMAYLIYGKELFDGIVKIARNLLYFNDLTIFIVVGLYFFIYTLWAVIIAYWAVSFVEKAQNFSFENKENIEENQMPQSNAKVIKSYWKFITITLILLAIACLTMFRDSQNITIYIVKTLALLFLFTFILPFIFRKIQGFYVNKNQSYIISVSQVIPKIRDNTVLAFQFSKDKKGLKKIEHFIFMCLWLNVFKEE